MRPRDVVARKVVRLRTRGKAATVSGRLHLDLASTRVQHRIAADSGPTSSGGARHCARLAGGELSPANLTNETNVGRWSMFLSSEYLITARNGGAGRPSITMITEMKSRAITSITIGRNRKNSVTTSIFTFQTMSKRKRIGPAMMRRSEVMISGVSGPRGGLGELAVQRGSRGRQTRV